MLKKTRSINRTSTDPVDTATDIRLRYNDNIDGQTLEMFRLNGQKVKEQ